MNARARFPLALAPLLLAGAIMLASPPPGRAAAGSKLAHGSILIASRSLQGSVFARSVVVLLEAEQAGALGLIVNRPMQATLQELLPDEPTARGRADRVYLGGPVSVNRLWLLYRTDAAEKDDIRVLEDVHASRHLDTLRRLLTRKLPPERMHAYLGYAGWGPGQLEGEVARGDWYIDRADPELLFEADAIGMWEKLVRRHEGRRVRREGWDPARAGAEHGLGSLGAEAGCRGCRSVSLFTGVQQLVASLLAANTTHSAAPLPHETKREARE